MRRMMMLVGVLSGLVASVAVATGVSGATRRAKAPRAGTACQAKVAFDDWWAQDFWETAIYVVQSDGTRRAKLTPNNGNHDPAWSPDGRKIAYVSEHGPGEGSTIWVMNQDGSRRRPLTSTVDEPYLGGGAYNGDSFPAWSPNGREIVYVYAGDRLRLMNADGSNQRPLGKGALGTDPAWSPNGRQIAFFGKRGLSTINVDGSNMRVLDKHAVGHPSWSPDGTTVAYNTATGGYGSGHVSLFDLRTGRSHELTVGEDPSWLPDGKSIVLTSNFVLDKSRPGVNYIRRGVLVIRRDGTGLRRLAGHGSHPAWQPKPVC
jgi:Tol biopolymer transport system component